MLLLIAGCETVPAVPAAEATFRDCADCPELVVIPSGRFRMGSPPTEAGRFEDEGPVHDVTIARPLAIMRAPVTLGEFARFIAETGFSVAPGCSVWDALGEWKVDPTRNWRDPGFPQDDAHPVVCVSWDEGQAYARWLSAKTGKAYRFLTEAEFEYAARAGAGTTYPWGENGGIFCAFANGFDQTASRGHPDWDTPSCNDGFAFTAPISRFPANRFGLLGTSGNAFQWVEDCFVSGGYAGAPTDGSARQASPCGARVIRGGSWANGPRGLRLAMRDRDPPASRYANISLRLARPLQ